MNKEDGIYINFDGVKLIGDEIVVSVLALSQFTYLASTCMGRIFRTTDCGNIWNLVEDGIITPRPLRFIRLYNNQFGLLDAIYAVNDENMLIRSFDSGKTWEYSHKDIWRHFTYILEQMGFNCNELESLPTQAIKTAMESISNNYKER